MLPAAIILITLALVFYTAGVWTERRAGILRRPHVVMFFLGLLFDVSGTAVMSVIAKSGMATTNSLTTVMAVTGAAALLLMAIHAVWAVVVLIRNHENELHTFHKFSVIVWAIWLVPYVTGMLSSMIG